MKIEKLEIKHTKGGENIGDLLVAFADELVVIKKKINEIIDEVERLERLNFPTTSLDHPEDNCKVCDHVHDLVCKCGCPAVRIEK